jgi:competence protein ComEA
MKSLLLAIGFALALSGAAWARVNVNTATQAELEALPEVGPVKAKAIMDYRKKNGPFKSLEDLEKVEGIGPATAKAIKNEVSFSGASTPMEAAKKPAPEKAGEKSAKPEGGKPAAAAVQGAKAPASKAMADKNKSKDKIKSE